MYLDIAEINKEIKAFKAARKLFMQQDFLDFIGRKCIKVLQLETALKAPLTRNNKMNDEFATGHTYQTQTLSNTSRIVLSNNATNQFGEYFSAYIEYGSGVFSPTTTRPKGWIYPTDEADRNPTKKYNKNNGTWYAFTWGQVPKNVYTDALKKIEENMDRWIEEYMKGG